MNIYTCNTFEGFWPVGTSAVIVAESEEHAIQLLDLELTRVGLPWTTKYDEFKLVDTTKAQAIILQDGNY